MTITLVLHRHKVWQGKLPYKTFEKESICTEKVKGTPKSNELKGTPKSNELKKSTK